MSSPQNTVDFLARVPLLSAFSEAERTQFASYLHDASFAEGQVIIWEGNAHDNLYILVKGTAVVTKVVRGDVESVLTHLEPGAHFGELDLIDGKKASATVTAETPCLLLSITQNRLLRLLTEDSHLFGKFAWAMMRDLASKLRETNQRLLEAVEWGLDAAAIDPTKD